MAFAANEGGADRLLRLLAAAPAAAIGVMIWPSVWAMVFLTASVLLLVTGLAGWCPIYAALRKNTQSSGRPR